MIPSRILSVARVGAWLLHATFDCSATEVIDPVTPGALDGADGNPGADGGNANATNVISAPFTNHAIALGGKGGMARPILPLAARAVAPLHPRRTPMQTQVSERVRWPSAETQVSASTPPPH